MKTSPIDYKLHNGIIAEPGKFEGDPLYVPYFWDMALQGLADDDYFDEGDVLISVFQITEKYAATFPELESEIGMLIEVWENEQGFVYHDFVDPDL